MAQKNGFPLLIGRVLLGLIFVIAGIGKIFDFDGTAAYIATNGLPMAPALVVATIIVEAGGGAALLAGFFARPAALALIGFTLIASLVFHQFWAVEPDAQKLQMIMFLKNLSIMGGLIYVAAFGPGPLSLDRMRIR
jgi:putative oxidoreductase